MSFKMVIRNVFHLGKQLTASQESDDLWTGKKPQIVFDFAKKNSPK